MKQRKIQRYGWKPDLPDFRDFYYRDVHSPEAMILKGVVAPINPITPGPAPVHNFDGNDATIGPDGFAVAVSLRNKMPPVFNQGQLGSCTANAGSSLFAFAHGGGPYSRLQLYYNERLMEGTVDVDSGGFLRDAIQVMAQIGIGSEANWPYIEANFKLPPPASELIEAAQNKAIEYSRLMTRQDFRQCLMQGHPFIVGFTVYSSFESDDVARTGIVPMPSMLDQVEGGHAVCVIGYNSNFNGGDYYEIRNSWGENWGDSGCFWLPAEYLENTNLACDAWTIRKTT